MYICKSCLEATTLSDYRDVKNLNRSFDPCWVQKWPISLVALEVAVIPAMPGPGELSQELSRSKSHS